MPAIRFFTEDIEFTLPHPRKRTAWIKAAIASEAFHLGNLNFIFCSDDYLLRINQSYLSHDTYTDIITFDNSETADTIEGDIFISIDRVRENAAERTVEFDDELDRVLIHGVLHLIGYSDKTSAEARQMRKKEDAYLSLRHPR